MEGIRFLGFLAIAGLLPVTAEDAGKAAAKAYVQDAAKAAPPVRSRPPAPGRMQVEEPASDAAATDARASQAWQKTHAKGLTQEQREAFRERKEKMEDMIALIKAKRQALRDAKPEDRAVIARELHSLILDREGEMPGAAAAARVESAPDPAAEKAAPREKGQAVREKGENQNARREEYRQRQQERHKARKNRDD